MTGLVIGFMLGWAACVAFIWLMESEDFEPDARSHRWQIDREAEINATTARLWGDQHPFHSTFNSREGQSGS